MSNIIPFVEPLTEEEEIIVGWQYQYILGTGDFETSLMRTVHLADQENLDRLSQAFPVHVRAYRRYISERGWWEKVQDKARSLGRIY